MAGGISRLKLAVSGGIDPGPGRKSGDFISWETIFSSCSWGIEYDNTRCDSVNSLHARHASSLDLRDGNEITAQY